MCCSSHFIEEELKGQLQTRTQQFTFLRDFKCFPKIAVHYVLLYYALYSFMNRDSSVRIDCTTGLRFPIGTGISLPPRPNHLWRPSTSFSLSVKLTTQFHCVPRSRMRGIVSSRPIYTCMVWCLGSLMHALPL